MHSCVYRGCTIHLVQGDITQQTVDAIVNAANQTLLGGGGVDGAIHRAAGHELLAACRRVRDEVLHGALAETAQPVLTRGYRLPAKYVIHVTGPVYSAETHPAEKLTLTYWNTLRLTARAYQPPIGSIAFPSISTGAFGFPIQEAAPVALKALFSFLDGVDLSHAAPSPLVDPLVPSISLGALSARTRLREIRMVLFSDTDLRVYADALQDLVE
ncbi:MAG: macro domain-containing protein [Alicyclobacillus herbarius]|uniref:macro domain-containing protein n=1 Tax=Alicyclobacillus herbarius TaxID=122960 RepID=UPI002357F8FB|nr:macro domain-containing protein [Alicyclobacillus herbarius]MCL6633955.1 macro domain-containing protein [Alicyclobacillus herbarius]